jgi:hypothetical protein
MFNYQAGAAEAIQMDGQGAGGQGRRAAALVDKAGGMKQSRGMARKKDNPFMRNPNYGRR